MDSLIGDFYYSSKGIKKHCTFDSSMENEDFNLVFQTSLQNNGNRIKIKIIPKNRLEIKHLSLKMNIGLSSTDTVFLNGYQTWTESREFSIKERTSRISNLINSVFNPYGDYTFLPYPKNNLHSWTYTYIRSGSDITLFGSLSEAAGFTVFVFHGETAMGINKDCSRLFIDNDYEAFDIFIITGEENYAFNQYFSTMNLPKPKALSAAGWTSWYNYYTNITEEIIIENLNAFKEKTIPIEIFQIDDGYEDSVGDWFRINKKFPGGMKYLSEKIKKCGFKSGLWLAPFICEKKSEIFRKHPDWIIGRAGYNPGWSGTFYALDFYNKEVQEYLKKVFNVVLKVWDFDMIKLDFLYAAALNKRKDKTRGQVMYEAMKFLREISGDKLILGCGVPLGSAFGLVDFCRIGSDASYSWEDNFFKFFKCRERISVFNCITNTIGRRHLNKLAFINDPDVFILRNKNNRLSKAQRYTFLIINLILGGLVFTSDNINEYTDEEMKVYETIFKLKEKIIEKVENHEVLKILFLTEGKKYMALCNLKHKKILFNIKDENYSDTGKKIIQKDNSILLEPYESVLLCKE